MILLDVTSGTNDIPIYVVAGLGFLATMTSPIVAARYIARSNRRAAESAAAQASAAATAAASAAAKASAAAQAATAQAAAHIAGAASATTERLAEIKAVADGTHQIVNSQRTTLLRVNATQARLIATLRPKDMQAQAAAAASEEVAALAEAAAAAIEGSGISQSGVAALGPI